MTENNNRVCCLYRVSTDKQVDFNSNHEADLPMQRKACHKFAESKGWVIVHEEQEEGVSGHKVRAAARDKLQIIKDYARRGKFDILLVFMFDRIGRIADETPFVVEWFVRNGIRVWSTQEGVPGAGQAAQGWQDPCGPRGKGSAPGPGSTAYAP